MSQLGQHREEVSCLSPMTTLSSMNTIYATGSLFSNRPPPVLLLRLALSSHSQGPFLSSVLCLILFTLSFPFFLQAKSRDMLPKHCKLIMALNIYYMMVGGLHGGEVRERERAGARNGGSSSGSSLWSHTSPVSQFHRGAVRKLGHTIKITHLCLIRRTDLISLHLSENLQF